MWYIYIRKGFTTMRWLIRSWDCGKHLMMFYQSSILSVFKKSVWSKQICKFVSSIKYSLCTSTLILQVWKEFSALRKLKTYLRFSIITKRLSALTIMNIHYCKKADYEQVALHKKWSFPLRISSVNLTKSASAVRKFLALHPRTAVSCFLIWMSRTLPFIIFHIRCRGVSRTHQHLRWTSLWH